VKKNVGKLGERIIDMVAKRVRGGTRTEGSEGLRAVLSRKDFFAGIWRKLTLKGRDWGVRLRLVQKKRRMRRGRRKCGALTGSLKEAWSSVAQRKTKTDIEKGVFGGPAQHVMGVRGGEKY